LGSAISWIFSMSFPKRIVELRKSKGLSQQALADTVGMHVNQIKRYEAGTTQPALDTLIRLAKTLCVTLDELVFDEKDRDLKGQLRLQFEAVEAMDEKEKKLASELLDSLILRYQAKQWTRSR